MTGSSAVGLAGQGAPKAPAPLPGRGIQTRSRLRTRMAASYVAVTMVIVLLLESLVVGAILYAVTISPLSGYWALQGAGNAAQIYALQAAVQAEGDRLNPAELKKLAQSDVLVFNPLATNAD